MINCSLRPQLELMFGLDKTDKIRFGRYHSSYFPVKEGYPIAVYIDGSFKQLLDSGKTEEEIVTGCVEYLNNQFEGKRKKKHKFGVLTSYQYSFKLREDKEEYYIIALLLTNERQNKNFWKEGNKK